MQGHNMWLCVTYAGCWFDAKTSWLARHGRSALCNPYMSGEQNSSPAADLGEEAGAAGDGQRRGGRRLKHLDTRRQLEGHRAEHDSSRPAG